VKVDCQAGVGLSGSTLGGGAAVAAKYHEALEKSVLANFAGNQCINCMCHSTENLYRWAMKAQLEAALAALQLASSVPCNSGRTCPALLTHQKQVGYLTGAVHLERG
jgi:hypothetical protein